jgi:radical SAM protein with 4Fe4S-binding SPASM domain
MRIPFKIFLPMLGRFMIEVPDLFVNLMRGVYKKHISSVLDYHLYNDGRSNSLWAISMRITNLCNHRCAICAQWGNHGYNFDKPKSQIIENVPIDTYKLMIDDIAHIRPHIYITGGEAFLYNDLVPLVNYMKQKRLSVQIVTNGVLLEKYAEEIVENRWDILCVSIDGTQEIHDDCRGAEGAYEALFKGVEKIQQEKLKRKSPKPYIVTITTVSKTNAKVLPQSLQEAKKLNPNGMVVYYSWFTTHEIGEKHTVIMQEELGITPTAWQGYILDRDGLDLESLVTNVRSIKSRNFGCPVLFVPELKLKEIPMYYQDPGFLFEYSRCISPWFMVDIMPDGSVTTCRDHPDYIVGNIQQDSLINIYNNEKYKAFRQALKRRKNGVFPICSRCCGLMGY